MAPEYKNKIKHLYVTGDSFVFGHGLKGHDYSNFYNFTPELRHTCYTGIIADTWGVNGYTNTALPGGSNDRMYRMVMQDIPELLRDIHPSELFVHIGLSDPSRTEFYSTVGKYYTPFLSNNRPLKGSYDHVYSFWEIYTAYFDDVVEHVDRYTMQVVNLQNFLKSLGIPYLITNAVTPCKEFTDVFNAGPQGLKSIIDKTRYLYDGISFTQFVE